MPTFTIRIADPRDVPTIARHRAEMFRDMGTLADDVYTTLLDATAGYLRRAMATGEYVGWLASAIESPHAIAAGAGLQLRTLIPRPDSHRGMIAGQQGLVVNVFTERPYRRQGLARRLMAEVLQWAAVNRVASVVLHASPDGRALYEEIGFVPTSEMRYVSGGRTASGAE
jgi:GNAT superfamily N-acetyltransferase